MTTKISTQIQEIKYMLDNKVFESEISKERKIIINSHLTSVIMLLDLIEEENKGV